MHPTFASVATSAFGTSLGKGTVMGIRAEAMDTVRGGNLREVEHMGGHLMSCYVYKKTKHKTKTKNKNK